MIIVPFLTKKHVGKFVLVEQPGAGEMIICKIASIQKGMIEFEVGQHPGICTVVPLERVEMNVFDSLVEAQAWARWNLRGVIVQ